MKTISQEAKAFIPQLGQRFGVGMGYFTITKVFPNGFVDVTGKQRSDSVNAFNLHLPPEIIQELWKVEEIERRLKNAISQVSYHKKVNSKLDSDLDLYLGKWADVSSDRLVLKSELKSKDSLITDLNIKLVKCMGEKSGVSKSLELTTDKVVELKNLIDAKDVEIESLSLWVDQEGKHNIDLANEINTIRNRNTYLKALSIFMGAGLIISMFLSLYLASLS